MAKYFTSDTHFDHAKLVTLCKFPFANVDEYNETLIANWNSVVKPEDVVYHLGDFGFHKNLLRIIERLTGSIILICGNHDRNNVKNLFHKFAAVKDLHEVDVMGEHKTILCHYPLQSWNCSHYGSFHLHGHCHGSMQSTGRRLDVGCMLHNWAPVSEVRVKELLGSKEFVAPAHLEFTDNSMWTKPLKSPAKVERLQ